MLQTLIILVLAPLALAHGDIDLSTVHIGSESCIDLSERSARIACYSTMCEPSYTCANSIIDSITESDGPAIASIAIKDIVEDESSATLFDAEGQGHNLQHIVGRSLAKRFGFSGDAFLSCTDDYQYGCVHGYFEQLLADADVKIETLDVLCESITTEPIRYNTFFCYHGIGHGIMMANANHPGNSLQICDEIAKEEEYAHACHQGVLHENIKAYVANQARDGSYNTNDPLYPCSILDQQYLWGCYVNQAAVTLPFVDFNFAEASHYCLLAPKDLQPICLGRFGQIAADVRWQKRMNIEEYGVHTALDLCNVSPKGFAHLCDKGATTHYLNSNEEQSAFQYCESIAEDRKELCYQGIGNHIALRQWGTSLCDSVPQEHHAVCVNGSEDLPVPSLSWSQKLWRMKYKWFGEGSAPEGHPYTPKAIEKSDSPEGEIIETITFDGEKYSQINLTIKQGQAVQWINESDTLFWPASDVHPTHELYPEFDATRPLGPGSTFTFTFDEAGEWTFHDHIHPHIIGLIVVEE